MQSSCVSALMAESERLSDTGGRLSCSCAVRLLKQGCLEGFAVAGGSITSAESLRLLPAAGASPDTMLEMLRLESDFAKPPLLDTAELDEWHEAIRVDSWAFTRP